VAGFFTQVTWDVVPVKFAWIPDAFGQIHRRKISPQLLNAMTSPLAQEVLGS